MPHDESVAAPSSSRRSYINSMKLEVIEIAKQKGNRAAAREHGVDESLVRRWRLRENVLKKQKTTAKAAGRGQRCRWPRLEKNMASWITAQRDAGTALSTVAIRLKASVMAKEMGHDDFMSSPSWCFRFMKRNNLFIRVRTTFGKKLPDDWEEKVQDFKSFIHGIIIEHNFPPSKVGNMDEVPMFFDAPQTVASVGEKSVKVTTTGLERTHFTAVLSCMADGTKLPPCIIFKRVTMPREKFPPGCFVMCNKEGRVNKEVMSEWLKVCWRKRPGSIFNPEGLLIMDSRAEHKTEKIKKTIKEQRSQLAIIPGGLTCKLQPLDVGVNHAFKVYVREEWEKWMSEGQHKFTPAGKLKKAKFSDACSWVVTAWNRVKQSTIVNSFIKVGVMPGEGEATAENSDTENEDNAEATRPRLSEELLALFHSDSEESEFDSFTKSNVESESFPEKKLSSLAMGKTKRKHNIQFKLQVINYAEQHSGEATARHFNIDSKRVRDWKSQKDDLVCMSQLDQTRARLGGGGRKKKSNELEVKMCEWIQGLRAKQVRVSQRMIRSKAKELYTTLNDGGSPEFTASAGWLEKFLLRNGFSARRSTAAAQEDAGQVMKKVVSYLTVTTQTIAQKEIKDNNIIAMAETEVWFDTARSTDDQRSGPLRATDQEKSHVTVVLAAKADGTKLKPYVIFKRIRDAKALQGINGIVVASNQQGKMNDRLAADWLQRILGKISLAPRLLVWDSCSCHTSTATTEELHNGYNLTTAVIPDGCTKWIHAPDIVWNQPFIAGLQDCYDGWMTGDSDRQYTSEGHLKAPTPRLLVDWVLKVWSEMDPELLKKSFKACGLTVAPDGSEDHLIDCFNDGEPWASGRGLLAQVRLQGRRNSSVKEEDMELVIIKEEELVESIKEEEEEEEKFVCVKVESL
ncbi:uncharacterized protein LOC124470774 [Hypomesus transpacificus]|uniref:uncharacterized protein LOC124470774 n=1 Tax=Hypomesus transpacificus TaxID=137520 RepID=UPI001F084185|nr:uncharacterized protein LOC124470774 [Hypomesus transpacificus]